MADITLEDLDRVAAAGGPQAGWARQEALRKRAQAGTEDVAIEYPTDSVWSPQVVKTTTTEAPKVKKTKKIRKLEKKLAKLKGE